MRRIIILVFLHKSFVCFFTEFILISHISLSVTSESNRTISCTLLHLLFGVRRIFGTHVGNFALSITNKSLVVFFIYSISNHSLSYHIFTMVLQSKSHNNNKNSCFKGNYISRYRAWSSRVLLLF